MKKFAVVCSALYALSVSGDLLAQTRGPRYNPPSGGGSSSGSSRPSSSGSSSSSRPSSSSSSSSSRPSSSGSSSSSRPSSSSSSSSSRPSSSSSSSSSRPSSSSSSSRPSSSGSSSSSRPSSSSSSSTGPRYNPPSSGTRPSTGSSTSGSSSGSTGPRYNPPSSGSGSSHPTPSTGSGSSTTGPRYNPPSSGSGSSHPTPSTGSGSSTTGPRYNPPSSGSGSSHPTPSTGPSTTGPRYNPPSTGHGSGSTYTGPRYNPPTSAPHAPVGPRYNPNPRPHAPVHVSTTVIIYGTPRAYYMHVPHYYVYRRWIQEPVYYWYTDGYWDMEGYPYYVYRGYRYRYNPVEMCQYELVDANDYTTVRAYPVQACTTAYDQCANERDIMNHNIGVERYFCAEAVDQDLEAQEEDYRNGPIDMSDTRQAAIVQYLAGKDFKDIFTDAFNYGVNNCSIQKVGSLWGVGNKYDCKYQINVSGKAFPATDGSICSDSKQAALYGCAVGNEKENAGCILKAAIESGYCH